MNEITLSNNLAQIELEISHHKQIAGQSIWEIGRRLNHVKENDLAHGEFIQWVEKQGLNRSEAYKMMRVAKELPNVGTYQHLGTKALYLIATLPDDAKAETLERIEQGDSPTVRELQEVKKKLKLAEQTNDLLKSENDQLRNQAVEVKVVEKEVVPEDYHATQTLNKQLLEKNRTLADEAQADRERNAFLEKQLEDLYAERAEVNEKSAKYDELTRAIEAQEGRLNDYQKSVSATKQTVEFIKDGYKFLGRFGGLTYLEVKPALGSAIVKRELETFAVMLNSFNDQVQALLGEDEILEGVFK